MPYSLQSYLLTATPKAAADLEAAVLRLPEDKRGWSPQGGARTALDQAAECAILNGATADMLKSRKWEGDMNAFFEEKAELAKHWHACKALLDENTKRALAAIKEVPESDLDQSIDMPWGPVTIAQIMSYPFWNMCYHEGQINYIASMIGCLD